MTAISLTPTEITTGLGVLLAFAFLWRAGAHRARAAAYAARTSARLVSLTGRVLFNAALIVIVQWVVIARGGTGWLLLAVLGLPALFAAYTLTTALTTALTVTTYDLPRRRDGDRR
jgi:hypothetical protein